MGVDYSHSAGYGIVLSQEDGDDFVAMAIKAKVKPYGYDSFDQFMAEVMDEDERNDAYDDDYEIVDALSRKYGLSYLVAGSSYSGELCFLLGDGHSDNNFWFEEINSVPNPINIAEIEAKLERFMIEMGISKKIAYYSGMHVY